MLEKALQALKSHDWGTDQNALKPIDEAVNATHGDADARKALEDKLVKALAEDLSFDAKQYICRKLMVIGTAASVPTLAALLPDEKLSHMSRYALERIPAPEAAKALRDALPQLSGELKIGVISSLGVRQDAESVPALAQLLSDSDAAVAKSAAAGLGAIRSPEAATALSESDSNDEASAAIADAKLSCAEAFLASGDKKKAQLLYTGLLRSPKKHIKVAATRGLLASKK